MKRMVCEMCGGTDLVKQDGVFVCQSCGTKYSVEEARKMMVEIEGTVEVTGTVKVDNTESVEKYIALAENACDGQNYEDCERYAKRALEIDGDNAQAWYLVGVSTAWQSKSADLRIKESIAAWKKALENVPEEQLDEMADNIARAYDAVSYAIMMLYLKQQAESSSIQVQQSYIQKIMVYKDNYVNECLQLSLSYISRQGKNSPFEGEARGVTLAMWNESLAIQEREMIALCRQNKGLSRLTSITQERLATCASLAHEVPAIVKEEDQLAAIDACIPLLQHVRSALIDSGFPAQKMIDQFIAQTRNIRDETEAALEKQKEKKRQKNIEKYWANHPDEKTQLETERQQLEAKLVQIEQDIGQLPESRERDELNADVVLLREEKESLGFFKGKEKNELRAQIKDKLRRIDDLDDEIARITEELTDPVQQRIYEIVEELTRDR